jgi:hypothetical protein
LPHEDVELLTCNERGKKSELLITNNTCKFLPFDVPAWHKVLTCHTITKTGRLAENVPQIVRPFRLSPMRYVRMVRTSVYVTLRASLPINPKPDVAAATVMTCEISSHDSVVLLLTSKCHAFEH